jgi:hypothetical protein
MLSATLVAAAGCATTAASTPSAHRATSSGHAAVAATIVRHGEVWLKGTITRDGCDSAKNRLPIGDVGCSITVNGYAVDVVNGNAKPLGKPGALTGLNVSTDQSGRHADVYAQIVGPKEASILIAPKYYARISG